MTDRSKNRALLFIAALGMGRLFGGLALEGDWTAVAVFGGAAVVLALGFWLRFRLHAERRVAGFTRGECELRGILNWDSVPDISLIPRLQRGRPGLEVDILLENDHLLLALRRRISRRQRHYEVRVPLSMVVRASTGPSRAVVGGRGLALELVDGQTVRFDLILAGRKVAETVATHLNQVCATRRSGGGEILISSYRP